MSQEKKYIQLIPKIYKRHKEDLLMFGYLHGIGDILRAFGLAHIPIEERLIKYYKWAGIDTDQANMESDKVTFQRMNKEYFENEQVK